MARLRLLCFAAALSVTGSAAAVAQTTLPPAEKPKLDMTIPNDIGPGAAPSANPHAGPAQPLPPKEKTEQETVAKLFMLLDSNGDGQVSPEEFGMRSDKDPAAADQDKDGSISLKDFSRLYDDATFYKKFNFRF